ncbi:serine/threonine-protein kinase SBK1-like [Rana temporaria]|uniref:serine/threonine-protein kinase SBK1-like n=1 Tax=Rana temporaria TaxID=8407 RepID=UPI001AAD7CB1|nr:serine/threonine-protein kinase SBK1-like [Rana temporaria]
MEVFGNMKKRVVDLEEVSSFHQGTPGIDLENYFKQLKHLMEKQIKICTCQKYKIYPNSSGSRYTFPPAGQSLLHFFPEDHLEDTMASVVHNVEGVLDRMVSSYSKGLQEVDLQEYFLKVKELGEGGYGRVLSANHRITGQKMALKIMDKNRISQRSFLQEFSISYLLSSHPNIIGCYGIAFTTIDYFVFVQELAPVGDLCSMILPHVGIPEDSVKRCAVQISNALEFMSEKGLVHMDLKPENILVFDKDCHSIKITDFGLAKVKGTVITSRSGSKFYMAPELRDITISDGLVVDGSLDVWSFGFIIYCLLTGEFPWTVATLDD